MDISSFFLWFIVVAIVGGIGIGAMIQAYVGSGSLSILFPDPIAPAPGMPPPTLNPEAANLFQQGCDAYRAGNYRRAIDRFNQVVQLDPDCAEAFHNRGLATANLRQDSDAAQMLLHAGELYLQQGNPDGFNQVKQDLEALKGRKQGGAAEEKVLNNSPSP
jgi:tetratricopeptide (TPR) repeat protein